MMITIIVASSASPMVMITIIVATHPQHPSRAPPPFRSRGRRIHALKPRPPTVLGTHRRRRDARSAAKHDELSAVAFWDSAHRHHGALGWWSVRLRLQENSKSGNSANAVELIVDQALTAFKQEKDGESLFIAMCGPSSTMPRTWRLWLCRRRSFLQICRGRAQSAQRPPFFNVRLLAALPPGGWGLPFAQECTLQRSRRQVARKEKTKGQCSCPEVQGHVESHDVLGPLGWVLPKAQGPLQVPSLATEVSKRLANPSINPS